MDLHQIDPYYQDDKCQLVYILTLVKEYKKMILNFYENTNQELDDAKSKKLSRKELDLYFSNYRKDKFLKQIYLECFNIFIICGDAYLNNEHSDYDKLINYLDIIINTHESTVKINEHGNSNAKVHFSDNGINLVMSFDFSVFQI